MSTTEVSCNCGAATLRIEGSPEIAFYCHCDDCRAVSGGAYVAVALFPKSAVTLTQGKLDTYTLRTLPRHRCANCGTAMYADVEAFDQVGLNAWRLPPGLANPAFHIRCDSALKPVVDDLPHYRDAPTDFGGSGETVGW